MRIAVMSDVHANLEALQAVLEDVQKKQADAIYCLGDVIGYGADPEACLGLVQAQCKLRVRGNHEHCLLQPEAGSGMNSIAAEALDWTRKVLSPESISAVETWPWVQTGGDARLVHASPRSPFLFEYIRSRLDCESVFGFFPEKICFLGHSHIPLVAEEIVPGVMRWLDPRVVELDPKCRYIINVGSVGQPRDGNPAARWVLVEDQPARVSFHAVPYDIPTAQAKIRRAGLSPDLADRLALGI